MKICIIIFNLILFVFSAAAIDLSKIDYKAYGFINASVIYGDRNPAWHTQYKANPDYGKSDLNFTMETSRLGLKIIAPEENNYKIDGVFEIDFTNGDNITNQNAELRLRKAYITIDKNNWKIIGGQTDMIIAQTEPLMLNGGYLGHCGNLYGQIPQLRIGYKLNFFKIEAGALKQTKDVKSALPQTQTGQFRYQARIAAEKKLLIFKNAMFALGFDKGKYSRDISESYAYSAELELPFKFGKISSEIFKGANIKDLLGSITMEPKKPEIKSNGAYFNLLWYFSKNLFSNAGYGYAKNKYSLLADLDYLKNRQKYINLWYRLTSRLLTAAEFYNIKSDMFYQNNIFELKSNRY